MSEPRESPGEEIDHEIVSHIFNISAAMVGVCLTAIGLLKLITNQAGIATLADDLLAFDAFLFVTCCFTAFFSFKTRKRRSRGRLERYVEVAFLTGLSLMVVACAMIVYEIA
jgi:hypothetical protein